MTDQTSEGLVAPLAWDTEFWGRRAARVFADDRTGLARAIEICDRSGIEWASLLVSADDVSLLTEAIRRGFSLVDVRYDMIARLSSGGEDPGSSFAHDDDVELLAAIARTAFHTSRFFSDEYLPNERCEDFYETWLRNSLPGPMADLVIVDRSPAGPNGFVTVKFSDDAASASLPLVAVAPDRQGQGVGRRLLSATIETIRARNVHEVHVATQLSNTAAIRLYQSGGFALDRASFWLHRWDGR